MGGDDYASTASDSDPCHAAQCRSGKRCLSGNKLSINFHRLIPPLYSRSYLSSIHRVRDCAIDVTADDQSDPQGLDPIVGSEFPLVNRRQPIGLATGRPSSDLAALMPRQSISVSRFSTRSASV